jgi:hypothetical protein
LIFGICDFLQARSVVCNGILEHDPEKWVRQRLLPQRTTDSPELFLFDQFQFALPLDWNAIILLRKVGIGPVGA